MRITLIKIVLYIFYYISFHTLIDNVTKTCGFIEDNNFYNDIYHKCSNYTIEYDYYIDFKSFKNFKFDFKFWEFLLGFILYGYYIM